MKNPTKQIYETPTIDLQLLSVEQGFDVSGETTGDHYTNDDSGDEGVEL